MDVSSSSWLISGKMKLLLYVKSVCCEVKQTAG